MLSKDYVILYETDKAKKKGVWMKPVAQSG